MSKKSFTLAELLIVAVVIAVLSSIAIPLYFRAVEQARGRSAVAQLMLIQSAEKIEELEENAYVGCVGVAACNLALDIDLPADNWQYQVVLIAGGDFRATASRVIPAGGGTCTYTVTRATLIPTRTASCIF